MRTLFLGAAVFSAFVSAATSPTNITIPAGYSVTAFATGLNNPTALTFAGETIWVTEAGLGGQPAVKTVDKYSDCSHCGHAA